jgi:hypothetical protein
MRRQVGCQMVTIWFGFLDGISRLPVPCKYELDLMYRAKIDLALSFAAEEKLKPDPPPTSAEPTTALYHSNNRFLVAASDWQTSLKAGKYRAARERSVPSRMKYKQG